MYPRRPCLNPAIDWKTAGECVGHGATDAMTSGDGISLQERLIWLFKERLNLSVASAETDLLETGILDSLTFVQLLFHIETEFGVTVSPDDLQIENFRSVSDIAQFVATRK